MGFFPGGIISSIPEEIPIRLQRGDNSWGGIHIATKHGHWLDKQKLDVHEMVWLKLRQPGAIYTTESDGKIKISLRIHPSALLILRLIRGDTDIFMTVVSVYFHSSAPDGTQLALYRPLESLPPGELKPPIPLYVLPTPPAPPANPVVIYKKKRTIVVPSAQTHSK